MDPSHKNRLAHCMLAVHEVTLLCILVCVMHFGCFYSGLLCFFKSRQVILHSDGEMKGVCGMFLFYMLLSAICMCHLQLSKFILSVEVCYLHVEYLLNHPSWCHTIYIYGLTHLFVFITTVPLFLGYCT